MTGRGVRVMSNFVKLRRVITSAIRVIRVKWMLFWQPKVTRYYPLDVDEEDGAFWIVGIEGVEVAVKKGKWVKIPEVVSGMIESYFLGRAKYEKEREENDGI